MKKEQYIEPSIDIVAMTTEPTLYVTSITEGNPDEGDPEANFYFFDDEEEDNDSPWDITL